MGIEEGQPKSCKARESDQCVMRVRGLFGRRRVAVVSIEITDLLIEVIAERRGKVTSPANKAQIEESKKIFQSPDKFYSSNAPLFSVNSLNETNHEITVAGRKNRPVLRLDLSERIERIDRPASFIQLESIIIRQMIESALPKTGSAFLGRGVGDDISRQKFAEVIADEVSKLGILGIAERIKYSSHSVLNEV